MTTGVRSDSRPARGRRRRPGQNRVCTSLVRPIGDDPADARWAAGIALPGWLATTQTSVTFEGSWPTIRRSGLRRRVSRSPSSPCWSTSAAKTTKGTGSTGEPTRLVVRAFKTLAENIVESLAKGDRVFVHGTVTTEAWTDKQTRGEAHRAAGAGRGRGAEPALGHGTDHQDHRYLGIGRGPARQRRARGLIKARSHRGNGVR
jgi:hypothetical protein